MTDRPKVIALFGVKGSGKDTIGAHLFNEHGYRREAFANPIKAMLLYAFPEFREEDIYGSLPDKEREYTQYPVTSCPWCGAGITLSKYDEDGVMLGADEDHRPICSENPDHGTLPRFVSPRLAMQTLGTQWGQRLYSDIWVDALFRRVTHPRRPHDRSLENDKIWEASVSKWVITDGRFWNELRCSNAFGAFTVRLLRGLDESTEAHASESEQRSIPNSAFNYICDNRCALEDLQGVVADLRFAAEKFFNP